MTRSLKDKVCIVTDAAQGIGAEIAYKYAALGAHVIVIGTPRDPADKTISRIKSLGARAMAFNDDISETQNAARCIRAAVETFGRIDVLVNNAGACKGSAHVESYPVQTFFAEIQSSIHTAFTMTHYAMPYLQETGGAVFFTGADDISDEAVYSGIHGWMAAFAKGITTEQSAYGVRAYYIAPSAAAGMAPPAQESRNSAALPEYFDLALAA